MGIFDLFGSPDAHPHTVSHLSPLKTVITGLEERTDRICRALGIDSNAIERRASDTNGFPSEVMEPLQRGNKLEAIKVYRELTNCGLKEAKDVIDQIAAGGVPTDSLQLTLLQAKLDAILARVEAER